MVADHLPAIHEKLSSFHEELLQTTRQLMHIPSVEEAPEAGAPFGRPCRQALDYMLQRSSDFGMTTENLDGYAGYGEFGSGKAIVASLGHLDVVPVAPGWKHEPWGAEIDGEYLFGRGAVDNKGPTVASLFAMRAIKETTGELPVRLRAIFGCNEESGFECIHHYNKVAKAPTLGIAPDSGWPLFHAEKGIASLIFRVEVPATGYALLALDGGSRPNIVIDSATARVRVPSEVRAQVQAVAEEYYDQNVKFTFQEGEMTVEAKGKAAHGAEPYLGDNAASRALRAVWHLAPTEASDRCRALFDLTHPGGNGLGIAGADDVVGPLTNNLGVANTETDGIRLLFNIRYPVRWNIDDISLNCRQHLEKLKQGVSLVEVEDSPPLFFPQDSDLVKVILEAYSAETCEEAEPRTMGGGTYARAVANTVSIGTGWAGDGFAHENDERVKVEHLYRMARLYASILARLIDQAA
jgi:succinyl-diaminopimelate desuccinylase